MSRKPSPRKSRFTCEQLESRALLTVYSVTTKALVGPGSLRAAIIASNNHAGPDSIVFNLPGTGMQYLRVPDQGLPAITGQVTIDGYTQPGSSPNTSDQTDFNNAVVTVNLVKVAGSAPILRIARGGSNSVIRGLSFVTDGWGGMPRLELQNTQFVTVSGNVFGATSSDRRLSPAVVINGGNNNTIGGGLSKAPALQNVMSSYDVGVTVANSTNNAIVNNIIGGQPFESWVPVQQVGVRLLNGANNNNVVRNVLYKNITPVVNQGIGNLIDDNKVVPRT